MLANLQSKYSPRQFLLMLISSATLVILPHYLICYDLFTGIFSWPIFVGLCRLSLVFCLKIGSLFPFHSGTLPLHLFYIIYKQIWIWDIPEEPSAVLCPVAWMFPDVWLDLIYPGIEFAFPIMVSHQDLQLFCAMTQFSLHEGVLMHSLDASLVLYCMACPHLV